MSLDTLAPIAEIESMLASPPATSTAATVHKNVDYIVVQAGGKGTRLEHLTTNKPKALVPVENLPMLFHLFRKFPDKRFVVIADYHREVLREYLAAFADVEYQVVDAAGSGTCGGVDQALALLPEGEPVLPVVADMRGVTFLDSSGINVLIRVHQQLSEAGFRLRIAAPTDTVRRVLSLVGIDTLVPCHSTLDDALNA